MLTWGNAVGDDVLSGVVKTILNLGNGVVDCTNKKLRISINKHIKNCR